MNIYYLLANKRSNSRQVDPRQKVGFEQWGRASIWKRRDTRTSEGPAKEDSSNKKKKKKRRKRRIGSNRREAGELEEGESEARQRGTAGALSPRE